MIELQNVIRRRKKRGNWIYVARDINMKVQRGDRVAILGPGGSGKSTLLRLLGGTEAPDKGKVVRQLRASWPIPTSGFLASLLSCSTNARFLARMYEVDQEKYVSDVKEVSELFGHINEPVEKLSGHGRQQLAFALGVCMDFDIYLFDDSVGVGPPGFRKKCSEIIEQLGQTNGIVLATSSVAAARQFCDQAYVLDEGHAFHYFDLNQAVSHYRDVSQRTETARENATAGENLLAR